VPSHILLSIWSALVIDYPQIAPYEKVHLKLNQFWMESIKREDPYLMSFDTKLKKLPTNIKLILELIREKEEKKSKEAATSKPSSTTSKNKPVQEKKERSSRR